MGLVLIFILAGVLGFVAAPAGILAAVALAKSPRQPPFWAACVATAMASAAAMYGAATASMLRSGEASWDLFIQPMLGYHLAAPVAAAALLWFVPRGPRRPVVSGIVTGLLLSVPVLIVLTIPLGFVVQSVFQLRFVP